LETLFLMLNDVKPTPQLSSPRNPKIKVWAGLQSASQRVQRQQVVLEGLNAVSEALALGWLINPLLLDESLPLHERERLAQHPCVEQVYVTNQACLAKVATTATPPAVLGLAPWPSTFSLCSSLVEFSQALNRLAPSRLLVLAGLQDPGNLGALLRCAAAFGVQAVVLVGEGVGWHHPKVIRASAGVLGQVPCVTLAPSLSLPEVLHQLNEAGVRPVLTAGQGYQQAVPYHTFSWPEAWALVLGTEGEGLTALPAEAWQHYPTLTIPMASGVESLNVGVAGGILLSHAANCLSG
jgi:TrmH family RNA methyltransferase